MTIVTERPGTLDPTHVRDTMSRVPTSVAVVAGQSELTGDRAAMIVGSFVFISLDPCVVGFFIGHESSSWPQLNKATVLGISALASTQAQFCRKLGKRTRTASMTASGSKEHTVPHWSQAQSRPWNAKSRTSRPSGTTPLSWPGSWASTPGTPKIPWSSKTMNSRDSSPAKALCVRAQQLEMHSPRTRPGHRTPPEGKAGARWSTRWKPA